MPRNLHKCGHFNTFLLKASNQTHEIVISNQIVVLVFCRALFLVAIFVSLPRSAHSQTPAPQSCCSEAVLNEHDPVNAASVQQGAVAFSWFAQDTFDALYAIDEIKTSTQKGGLLNLEQHRQQK